MKTIEIEFKTLPEDIQKTLKKIGITEPDIIRKSSLSSIIRVYDEYLSLNEYEMKILMKNKRFLRIGCFLNNEDPCISISFKLNKGE